MSLTEFLKNLPVRIYRSLRFRLRRKLLGPHLERRTMTHAAYREIERQFPGDRLARGAHLASRYNCGMISDPLFVALIKKFKKDFNLHTFFETGTYDGDTSLFMSFLFERVLTCDNIDWPRRPEFFLTGNIEYETLPSLDFMARHREDIRTGTLFFLDAHWHDYWPLLDELRFIFAHCERPVLIIDDFDTGCGLEYDSYKGVKLDLDYIARAIPGDYRFVLNPWSNRNRGMIFLFPGEVHYGCTFAERANYHEQTHGLWDKEEMREFGPAPR